MGFNSVYRSLQDIFPQVDSRLLRAVAIEHPKDADVAAEIVITEIIPSISKKLFPVVTPQDMSPRITINLSHESEDEGDTLTRHQPVKVMDVGSSSHEVFGEITKGADSYTGPDLNVRVTPPQNMSPVVVVNLEDEIEEEVRLVKHQLVEDTDVVSSASSSYSIHVQHAADPSCGLDLNVDLNESTLSNASDINVETNTFRGINADGNLTTGISDEISRETSNGFWHEASENFDQGRLDKDVDSEILESSGVYQVLETGQNHLIEEAECVSYNGTKNANNLNEDCVDFVPTTEDYDTTNCYTSHTLENCETSLIELEGFEGDTVSHVQGHSPTAKDCNQIEFNAHSSTEIGETSHIEDEIDGSNELSQDNRACSIDMLEETIDEAKTNKKTLFSSMESLINLMREVEHQEKLAEQANMAAASGGSDILDRVEEYKPMLVHAKEANDMHAGEVYGEKAILATELKELQSRLSSLSGERDKSLAILDEMRQILESRLAAAEMSRKAAELEKLEKEGSARMALLEQEAMMEKVVQESRRLQLEAEENSKLREFLMDRGQVVDTLQGEISVICHDIRLLKEKFDANLPLSKSFTSSQTSCILASSGSSGSSPRSLACNVDSQHNSSEVLKITQASPIVYRSEPEERSKAEQNALLDDGWDIFDKDAELDS